MAPTERRAAPNVNSRRTFLKASGSALALAAMGDWSFAAPKGGKPLNILFVTADDLNCDSLGCYGNPMKGISPNLDAFAKESMRFERGHVTAAICMPSRIVLATGLYGHNSGAMGFNHARPGTPNVIRLMRTAGYRTGVLGKLNHSTACPEDMWDDYWLKKQLGNGRSPAKYHEYCKAFFSRCKANKQPFYLMVNSHDPHRPFQQFTRGKVPGDAAKPSQWHKPKDIQVPGFLPDLPGVRKELSQYYNSVQRLDDTFGQVMKALDDSGFADNTLVMFLSDNGIAMPFAKANCYLTSTRTPWIVRWPGVTRKNSVNTDDFISGIDYLPTILEAAGLPKLPKQDGNSFVPLLEGKEQKGREWVYTQVDTLSSGAFVPMRCIQNDRYGYIFNAWSDGKTRYRNANEGQTMKAMEEAAKTDESIAARINVFRYRALEEFYDLQKDPDCIHNLMKDPNYAKERKELIGEMESWMKRTTDPLLAAFKERDDPTAIRKNMRTYQRAPSGIRPFKAQAQN